MSWFQYCIQENYKGNFILEAPCPVVVQRNKFVPLKAEETITAQDVINWFVSCGYSFI
jgi:hypothetical protein